MNLEKEPGSIKEFISRRKFLIYLGIFLGIIMAGLSFLRKAGIKTINTFRIRSIEQTPAFDPDTWKLTCGGQVWCASKEYLCRVTIASLNKGHGSDLYGINSEK